jgi:hypothetical protein
MLLLYLASVFEIVSREAPSVAGGVRQAICDVEMNVAVTYVAPG